MVKKYRVWDLERKFWVPGNILVDNSGLLYLSCAGQILLIEKPERYDVQYSTGLKDKAGKEIYEGDILEQKYETIQDYSSIQKVVWICDEHEVGFNLTPARPYGYVDIGFEKASTNLVIGNIHENPELLKEKT